MMDLEKHLVNSPVIKTMVLDDEFAGELYAALCNMQWKFLPDGDDSLYSCTWRYAGGLVADLRNASPTISEGYLDWYCNGNEGVVSDRVASIMEGMGWVPVPYED